MIKFTDLPQEIKDAAIAECKDIVRRFTDGLITDEQAIRSMEKKLAQGYATFHWSSSNIKYGAIPSKRYDFWANIFVHGDFKEFFEKFPKEILEEVEIDNVKYVL